MILLLLGLLTVSRQPALTPGAIRPLTTVQICAITWGLDVRHVSAKTRDQVFDAYGIAPADRAGFIIDHLIPRELGGADALANLWPEGERASHIKDRTENALHRALCATPATVTLRAAQQRMRRWMDPP